MGHLTQTEPQTKLSLLRWSSAGLASVLGCLSLVAISDVAAAEPVTPGLSFLAPYYVSADLTSDAAIDTTDIDVLVASLGATSADPRWRDVEVADFDSDGEITLIDIANLSERVIYDDGPFEIIEATTLDVQKAMAAGVLSAVELTQLYLDRIAEYDAETGADLNSLITVNGAALEIAAELDAEREESGPRGMLHGIPVIAKDNYNTFDMPTSAGCTCFAANETDSDSFMIDQLRADGAVILAKANLDEFAFSFTTVSSLGGTSFTPYDLTQTAGGSSGGTGASIAANLGIIGLGTDTGGSIRVPASYNQLVGLRPTVGLASRDGIVPLALSQDTGGPMTRTVADAALALDSFVGYDPQDPVTAESDGHIPDSYTAYLDTGSLQGATFGYIPELIGTNAAVNRLFSEAIDDLEAQGATVVEITDTTLADTRSYASGSAREFNNDLNDYIEKFTDPVRVPHRSLRQIFESGDHLAVRSEVYDTRSSVTDEQYAEWMLQHDQEILDGEAEITETLDRWGVDALIYVSSTNQYATAGTHNRLSPNSGMPAISVPMGSSSVAIDGVEIDGAGTNLEILGRNYSEGQLLGYAYAYEQYTGHRTSPEAFGSVEP